MICVCRCGMGARAHRMDAELCSTRHDDEEEVEHPRIDDATIRRRGSHPNHSTHTRRGVLLRALCMAARTTPMAHGTPIDTRPTGSAWGNARRRPPRPFDQARPFAPPSPPRPNSPRTPSTSPRRDRGRKDGRHLLAPQPGAQEEEEAGGCADHGPRSRGAGLEDGQGPAEAVPGQGQSGLCRGMYGDWRGWGGLNDYRSRWRDA